MAQKRRPKEQARKKAAFPILWAMLIVALALAAYVNSLRGGFILDDESLIGQSSPVRNLQLHAIVDWGSYRPVRTLTYALNYWLGGEHPFGYHLFNVLLHALNAFLVFALFYRWTRSRLASVVGAAVFAVHPAQTAAVAYISGRKDELATVFLLAACLAFTTYLRKRRIGALLLVFLCYALAVMSKEVAVVFPALALLIDAFIVGPQLAAEGQASRQSLVADIVGAVKRSPAFYGISAALVLLGAYYTLFVVEASRAKGFWGGSWQSHYGTVPKLFVHYVKLAVTAHPLIADYTGKVFRLSRGFADPATLASIVFVIAYLYVAFAMRRRNAAVTFGMLWFVVALLPVLQIVPFHELAADHFLYLPLIGPAFMVGVAAAFLASRWGWTSVAAGAGALTLVCFIATVDRNRDWKDEYSLWNATYQAAPYSYRANHNLGMYYYSAGDVEKAIRHTKRAIELDPSREQAWSNLGALYRFKATTAREAGDLITAEQLDREALKDLDQAVRMEPRDVWAYANRGQVYRDLGLIRAAQGQPEAALQMRRLAVDSYLSAIRIGSDNPSFPLVWFEFGKVFVDAGYYDQALFYLGEAAKGYPQNAGILYELGFCHFKLGHYRQAISYLAPLLQVHPDSEVAVWGMLAKSKEELGDNKGAVETYERARGVYPTSVEILYNLGVLYHRIGDTDKAIGLLEQAFKLSPNGPLAGNISRMLEVMRREPK